MRAAGVVVREQWQGLREMGAAPAMAAGTDRRAPGTKDIAEGLAGRTSGLSGVGRRHRCPWEQTNGGAARDRGPNKCVNGGARVGQDEIGVQSGDTARRTGDRCGDSGNSGGPDSTAADQSAVTVGDLGAFW